MSGQKLTSDQQKRINEIMKEWHNEIDKIPETPKEYYGGGFNCKKAAARQKLYEALRDKYMPMIQKIMEEMNDPLNSEGRSTIEQQLIRQTFQTQIDDC